MANENMQLSSKGRNLIAKWEGLRLTAYQDSVGIWTIGYGHTSGVTPGMTITEDQANSFLDEDVKSHVTGIFRFVTAQLNQNQFDALVSFHFNLGAYILQNSQLLVYINSQQWQLAASEMQKYVYANGKILQGLVDRRYDEANLFLESSESKPEQTKKGEITMNCFYKIDNKAQIYYFDGKKVRLVGHPDEKKVLNDIYKANNGKDIPEFSWNSSGPMYARLLAVINRDTI
ncbi:lysozyme [Enterococcus sp. AZ170]|uniref:lysozyme n=1 Tax=Enterococcus sp. AZ170 TaxID=2774747 RepID=UPI003D2FD648